MKWKFVPVWGQMRAWLRAHGKHFPDSLPLVHSFIHSFISLLIIYSWIYLPIPSIMKQPYFRKVFKYRKKSVSLENYTLSGA